MFPWGQQRPKSLQGPLPCLLTRFGHQFCPLCLCLAFAFWYVPPPNSLPQHFIPVPSCSFQPLRPFPITTFVSGPCRNNVLRLATLYRSFQPFFSFLLYCSSHCGTRAREVPATNNKPNRPWNLPFRPPALSTSRRRRDGREIDSAV